MLAKRDEESVFRCPSFTPIEPSNVLRWSGVVPSFTDKASNVPPPPLVLMLFIALVPCGFFLAFKTLVDLLQAPWLWIMLGILILVLELYNIVWHRKSLSILRQTFYFDRREVVPSELREELRSYLSKDSDLASHLQALAGRDQLSDAFLRRNLSYHMFAQKDHLRLNTSQVAELDSILSLIRRRAQQAGLPICPSSPCGPDTHSDSFMDADLSVIYKPFLWYLAVRALQTVFRLWIRSRGFSRRRLPGCSLSIFHRLKNVNAPVLVFCHGFGIGCASYVYLVSRLLSTEKDMNIVLVELPNLSYSSYQIPHPQTEELVRDLHRQLTSLGIYRCLMVSHSYGTVIHNVFKHKFPGVITCGILLDPVCLMVHQPKVARMRSISLNELVARETKVKWWQKFITSWSFIVVFRDIFTQFVMCRTFFLEHSYLSKLDDRDTLVFAENDVITPSKAIHQYLDEHHPSVRKVMRQGVGHGEVLYAPDFAVDLIASAMSDMVAEGATQAS